MSACSSNWVWCELGWFWGDACLTGSDEVPPGVQEGGAASEAGSAADAEERHSPAQEDDEAVEDEEDVDDFLVDEDGKPLSKGPKKKKHIFKDA